MSLSADLEYRRGSFRLALSLEVDGTGVVMGPSGSGKTTLLKLLLGVLPARAGRIMARGRLLYDHRREIDRPPEERRLAYVPRGLGLFPNLSVIDNVAFGIQSGSYEQQRSHALDLLEGLGVAGLADRSPESLEPDAQLYVALARALSANPDALLLDEPLSTLDPHARASARAFLAAWLLELGLDTIVVTRDVADARELATRIFILENGALAQEGTPDEVAFRPATQFAGNLTAGLIERESYGSTPGTRLSEDE